MKTYLYYTPLPPPPGYYPVQTFHSLPPGVSGFIFTVKKLAGTTPELPMEQRSHARKVHPEPAGEAAVTPTAVSPPPFTPPLSPATTTALPLAQAFGEPLEEESVGEEPR